MHERERCAATLPLFFQGAWAQGQRLFRGGAGERPDRTAPASDHWDVDLFFRLVLSDNRHPFTTTATFPYAAQGNLRGSRQVVSITSFAPPPHACTHVIFHGCVRLVSGPMGGLVLGAFPDRMPVFCRSCRSAVRSVVAWRSSHAFCCF